MRLAGSFCRLSWRSRPAPTFDVDPRPPAHTRPKRIRRNRPISEMATVRTLRFADNYALGAKGRLAPIDYLRRISAYTEIPSISMCVYARRRLFVVLLVKICFG